MIKVDQLTKIYNGNKGIRDISFQIKDGETFGFLGPNGAGKTTTIRVLQGFIKPTSGKAQISGLDCWRDTRQIKELVAYLPGEINFLEDMSGFDFLQLMIGMHGNRKEFAERRDQLCERLAINLKQPIKKMSKGMKQKIGIIYTFMLDAKVLILDEPTSGLDPLMQNIFIDLILEEKEKGKTIFISSHLFKEVERTCDRVGIIRDGELVTVEGIHGLKQTKQFAFDIEVQSEEQVAMIQNSGLEVVAIDRTHLTVLVHGELDPFLRTLAQVNVKDFVQRATGLEEAFMFFYH